eukprot:TRINITY_DN4847_c0_g1_i1.p1 TRINITY_DN4847_c0_g1~~TRINITY_DN4847_c0_g1_i1.p1  ORF type:complete len:242 (-),score=48.96 TRINITY_DN4847_c0_g1_i1:587-1312(-)
MHLLHVADGSTPVPPAFHAAAMRWARGQANSEDHAAMCALSMHQPLAPAFDAVKFGFDVVTRLPPAHALPLFDEVKNRARAQFHADAAVQARRALEHAVLHPTKCAFPQALGALPAAAGLAVAARLGIGKRFCVSWTVEAAVLEAAGTDFVGAAFGAGFVPQFDVEDRAIVSFISRLSLSDTALRHLEHQLRRANHEQVLPAGAAALTDIVRQPDDDDDDEFNCADLLAFRSSIFSSHSKL